MTPWKEVAAKSAYVQACTTSKLCWCHLCQEDHGPGLLCFEEQHMSPEHQDIFRDLLDQSLYFSWDTEGSHRQIFRLCAYFLLSEDHILPLFMNSLHPDYARFYDKYSYLEFLFEMAEARYDVLASFLLSYLNRHEYTLCPPLGPLSRDLTGTICVCSPFPPQRQRSNVQSHSLSHPFGLSPASSRLCLPVLYCKSICLVLSHLYFRFLMRRQSHSFVCASIHRVRFQSPVNTPAKKKQNKKQTKNKNITKKKETHQLVSFSVQPLLSPEATVLKKGGNMLANICSIFYLNVGIL